MLTRVPCVLCISGHDPSGGAGIQADIEAVTANGCHACTAITSLTVQDTCKLVSVAPQPTQLIASQIRAVIKDSWVAAIKIGLLANAEMVTHLGDVLGAIEPTPIILDPVLASGTGTSLADSDHVQAMRRHLLPITTLITPNSNEARLLAPGNEDLDKCAQSLIESGCGFALVTGTHEQTSRVINRLHGPSGLMDRTDWPRLPGSFHGSGCTLASAIAARLALLHARDRVKTRSIRSDRLLQAVRDAQGYTWDCLNRGLKTGRCQFLPDRLHRLRRG